MKLFLSLVLAFLTFERAHALVFVEPMLGYSTGSIKAAFNDGSTTTNFDFDVSGPGYGARAGVSLMGLQVGLDYMSNNYKAKILGTTDSFTQTETSLFLGYRLLFFRLYGAYMLSVEDDDDDGAKLDLGYKVGATFYAFTNIALSLEMRQLDFKPFVNEDGDTTTSTFNTMALVVSFPFEI